MDLDNLEDEDLLDMGDETPSKEFEAKVQFGTISKANCNMIMVLPKSLEAKSGQPSHLEGDVKDMSKPISTVSGHTLVTTSIEIKEDENGEAKVILKQFDSSRIKHI